jgi:hypothetical protein
MKYAVRATVIAVAVGIVWAVAPTAQAQTNPGYEQYIGCPNIPTVGICMRTETNSGHIQIGKTDTPINKQIVLTGGLDATNNNLVFSSQGGLFAPPLNVPGGLTGLTGLSEFIINLITFGANQVQAQAILVGTPHVTLTDNTDLTLPVRVKLINPFLTSTCSIGSAGSPLNLTLTTGTTAPPLPNKPISGVANEAVADTLPGTLISKGNVFVDNAFSAPTASGCDLLGFGLINALVNARVGLPAAAGTNTAVFSDTTLKIGFKAAVYPAP